MEENRGDKNTRNRSSLKIDIAPASQALQQRTTAGRIILEVVTTPREDIAGERTHPS